MCHFAKIFLVVVMCLTICSCATARLPNQGNIKSTIEMKTYRINIAEEKSWKDWEASTKSENDLLVLKKLNIWPLNGQVQGYTNMAVMRDSITPEGWSLAEKEHADNVRTIEEKIMREKGRAEGKYEIEELTKGDLVHNGKRFYFMKWTTFQRDGGAVYTQGLYMKGAMFLYFPEDFANTHAFYRFAITDTKIHPSFINVNVEQIFPLIDGFAVK